MSVYVPVHKLSIHFFKVGREFTLNHVCWVFLPGIGILVRGRSSVTVGGWRGATLIELRCCTSDGQSFGHCITVRQAPFRCVGLWAKHWAVEMLSPRPSPQGGLGLLRRSSLHTCVAVSRSRNQAADILAVWRGSSHSAGEAPLWELPGGSDPWADSGRTSVNHFNLFNKGVRKEERTGKSPRGPESYPASHFGLEVYGLKHHLLFCGVHVFSLLSLCQHKKVWGGGETAGLSSVGLWLQGFHSEWCHWGGRGVQGASHTWGSLAVCFPGGGEWEAGQPGSGDPASRVWWPHHWVITAPTPCASLPQVREGAFWWEDGSHAGGWSLLWAMFCFWDSHLSPDHPRPVSHRTCSFFWETHLHLNTLAHCYFRHQNVNHSFEFLGRWNLWGLQLPRLCKQPLFKTSLEWVLHRKKMLCGNWALKLPRKYIHNCI